MSDAIRTRPIVAIAAAAAIAACGRIGYDALTLDASGGDATVNDDAAACATTPPRSWAFPNAGTVAAAMPIRLGVGDPAARIYYTTDGSDPTIASTSVIGVASSVTFTSQTPVKHFATKDCAVEAPARSATYTVDSSVQTTMSYLASNLSLGNGSPVAVVSPGAAISGSGDFQWWLYTSCPGCIMQIVYGIESNPVGCIVNNTPGLWPGSSGTRTFSLTAPATPGTYYIYTSNTTQVDCDTAALASYAASAVAGGRQLGVIVVQ